MRKLTWMMAALMVSMLSFVACEEPAPAPEPEPTKEEVLLTEIRDLLKERK
jgi:large conductance mechanosensitive channel